MKGFPFVQQLTVNHTSTQPDSFTRTAVCLEGYFSKRCYILLKGLYGRNFPQILKISRPQQTHPKSKRVEFEACCVIHVYVIIESVVICKAAARNSCLCFCCFSASQA